MPSGQVQQGREGWSGLRGREEKSEPRESREAEVGVLVDGSVDWRSDSRSAALWTSFLADWYSSISLSSSSIVAVVGGEVVVRCSWAASIHHNKLYERGRRASPRNLVMYIVFECR